MKCQNHSKPVFLTCFTHARTPPINFAKEFVKIPVVPGPGPLKQLFPMLFLEIVYFAPVTPHPLLVFWHGLGVFSACHTPESSGKSLFELLSAFFASLYHFMGTWISRSSSVESL